MSFKDQLIERKYGVNLDINTISEHLLNSDANVYSYEVNEEGEKILHLDVDKKETYVFPATWKHIAWYGESSYRLIRVFKIQ